MTEAEQDIQEMNSAYLSEIVEESYEERE